MTTLARTRVALAGWSGGPGVNTFHWSAGTSGSIGEAQVDDMHAEIAAVFTALEGYMVSGVTWQVEPEVTLFDSATGAISGVQAQAEDTYEGVGSSSTTSLSRAEMVYTRFQTDQWIHSRRLAGGFYWGPIGTNTFDTNGTIKETFRAEVENQFVAPTSGLGARLAVWHRPSSHGASDGLYGDVVRVLCRDIAGTLRSRKT